MRGLFRQSLAGLVLCTGLLSGPARCAPLVVNGDFETGDLTGWNGGGIVTCFTDPTLAHAGNSGAAFLAFISPAQLFQDISTVVGHQYRVQFFAATSGSPFSASFQASFGGTSLSLTPTLATTYTLYSFVVSATSTLTTLSFDTLPDINGSTPDTYLLDDVSVTDLTAPELNSSSASLPMLWILASLLVVQGRRRSKWPSPDL